MAIGREPPSPLRPPIDGAVHHQEQTFPPYNLFYMYAQFIINLPVALLVARLEAMLLTDPLLIDTVEWWPWPIP